MNNQLARWACWGLAIAIGATAAVGTVLDWADTLTIPAHSVSWSALIICALGWAGHRAGPVSRRYDAEYLADMAEAVRIGRVLERRQLAKSRLK